MYSHSYLIWVLFSVSISSFSSSFFFGTFLGSKGTLVFICSNSVFLFFIASYLFFCSFSNYTFLEYDLGTWFSSELINVTFGIRIDPLSSTMLFIITTISLFAQLYSVEYMYYDTHKSRFFGYLAMFTFFMLILVVSNNLILLFVGWEGVGICSYLLINFWYFRVQANKSAILAVVANKIGDLSLLVGTVLIQEFSNTSNFFIFNSIYTHLLATNYVRDAGLFFLANSSLFFFILACVGKSAQFGLHIWLPEAMEGPTPVSSLIHAATMVTAGIYLILRVSFLFNYVSSALILILLLGSFTTLFASSIGLVQFDLKKVVAYSTCSQLGYMFLGCGFQGYNFVIFHLFIHAFFKALLFLTAGYLIHLLSNEQDVRKMGGLLYLSKFSYVTMGIGSLALIGFPFLSGFYSKEKIIEELTLSVFNVESTYMLNNVFFISAFFAYTTLILTVLYSFKIYSDVFLGSFNGFKNLIFNISYSELFIVFPLFLLSLLSIYSGFFFNEAMVGVSSDYWGNSFFLNNRYLNICFSNSHGNDWTYYLQMCPEMNEKNPYTGVKAKRRTIPVFTFLNYGVFILGGVIYYVDYFTYGYGKAIFACTATAAFMLDQALADYYYEYDERVLREKERAWDADYARRKADLIKEAEDSLPEKAKRIDYFFFNSISESEWFETQWVVPLWTFYYMSLVLCAQIFFFDRTKKYTYYSTLAFSFMYSFFSSLIKKYIYLNRLLFIPITYYFYSFSYNNVYRIVEKGLLEQFGGYGLFNLIGKLSSSSFQKKTFLLYHYLGLIVITIVIMMFFLLLL